MFIIGSVLILCIVLFYPLMYKTSTADLGGGFTYGEEQKHILGKIDIPPYVLSYDYDERFIVAKQRPKEYNEAIYDRMEYVYPLGRETTYYWLILKKEQKVLGPLDSNKYEQLKSEYNVSDKLVLK